MKEHVSVYLIGNDIQVDVRMKVVTRIYISKKLNSHAAEGIILGDTSMRLLDYLLDHAEKGIVNYGDVLHEVWDLHGLVSSYKRLGQVIKELKEKLKTVGISDDAISNVRGQGYRLNFPQVTRLYRETVNAK